jgi:two-component system sensor histidine kinase KdpD
MKFFRINDKSMVTSWKPTKNMFTHWQGYLWGALAVGLVTLIGYYTFDIYYVFSFENLIVFYLLIVVISSIYWGLGPSIFVSLLTIIVVDYLFITPIMGFVPTRIRDVITLVVLLVISIMISYLASRFKQKTEEAQKREQETNTLYALNRDLSSATELNSGIQTIIKTGRDILGYDMAIFLPAGPKKEELIHFTQNQDIAYDTREAAIASWCFQNRKPAGMETNNFPTAKARYMPLITPRGMLGVLSLWGADKNETSLTNEQIRLLKTFTDLTAISIENIKLAEEAHKTEALKAKEQLQTALLNSISHDLRTPLVSVIGVLSSLQEDNISLDEAARKNLIQVARDDAERLNRLIANLLDISRLEAGAVKLLKRPSDIADLIGVALEQLGNRATARHIEIDVPTELPFVDVDFNLVVQALVNILDNAFKYSPGDSSIEISSRQFGREIELEVADHGTGIPQQDLPHIFDKFYRISCQTQIPGTGLGLSICKGIIEANGGTIAAENRLGGGTIIKLKLPAVETGPENGMQKQ